MTDAAALNADTTPSKVVDEVLDEFEQGYGAKPVYAKDARKLFHRLLLHSTKRAFDNGMKWEGKVRVAVLTAALTHGSLAKAKQGKEQHLELADILDTLDEVKANCPSDNPKVLGLVCDF